MGRRDSVRDRHLGIVRGIASGVRDYGAAVHGASGPYGKIAIGGTGMNLSDVEAAVKMALMGWERDE